MKTYKELEREAYITGNTELAKAYAKLIDALIREQDRDCEADNE